MMMMRCDVMMSLKRGKSIDMKKRPNFESFLGSQNGALFGAVRKRGCVNITSRVHDTIECAINTCVDHLVTKF